MNQPTSAEKDASTMQRSARSQTGAAAEGEELESEVIVTVIVFHPIKVRRYRMYILCKFVWLSPSTCENVCD